MPKRILAVLALLALAACNTVEGAGRDISTAGDTLTDEAQEAK
jgi:entericidin B